MEVEGTDRGPATAGRVKDEAGCCVRDVALDAAAFERCAAGGGAGDV